MKFTKTTLLLAFILILSLSCEKKESIILEDLIIPDSMKGYELYSWMENENWSFTIITGTNRIKTHEEITKKENNINSEWIKITVSGIDSLKAVINNFPPKQSILWQNKALMEYSSFELGNGILSFPPEEIINEIIMYCNSKNILLTISD